MALVRTTVELASELADLQQKYTTLQAEFNEQQQQLHQAQDQLDAEHQLLLTLLRNLPISVYIKDRQGRLVLANRTTMHQWGWQRKADYYGKTDADFQLPEYAEIFRKEDHAIMESGLPLIRDERQDSRGGWHIATKVPLYNEDQQVIGLLGFNEPSTDQQQAVAEPHDTIRLLAMAMHEFNTPLAAIMLSVQMIQKYQDQWSREQVRARLGRIHANSIRLNQLMQDMHTIIMNDLQRLSFNPQPVNLVALCQQIIYKHQDEANGKITYEPAADRQMVLVDPNLMEYVLDNLLSNALKYSAPTQTVHLTTMNEGDQLIISVQDRGIGIPDDEQQYVFDDFFRASNVGDIAGTGLGLAIVTQFVKRHRGTITLESVVGHGTTVIVRIPAALD